MLWSFLKKIFAPAQVVIVPATTSSPTEEKRPPAPPQEDPWAQYQLTHTYTVKVMGTNYANEDGEWRSELMCSSNIGDELRVVPEPDNEYDPNAIALYNDKGKIGYLPASYAEQGESCLRRGGLVRAVVKDIEVGERRSRDDKMYIVLRYYSPK